MMMNSTLFTIKTIKDVHIVRNSSSTVLLYVSIVDLHFNSLKEIRMCADGSYSRIEDAVGECPECGGRIDKDNDTVEECCNHAQWTCPVCGNSPCTGYC